MTDSVNLYREARNLIDTEWHYSYHWEKTSSDTLTEKGIKQAIEDCRERRDYCFAHAIKLNKLLFKLSKEVDVVLTAEDMRFPDLTGLTEENVTK